MYASCDIERRVILGLICFVSGADDEDDDDDRLDLEVQGDAEILQRQELGKLFF